jgi:cob(I)alamin adenosyltransferase
MKIYTKSGDAGTTGLFAGPRVYKDDARIVAYGTVDELNAFMGVVVSGLDEGQAPIELDGNGLAKIIQQIQSDLFCIGAELATPDPDAHGMRLLPASRIGDLEVLIDSAEAELPKLTNFILPSGTQTAAQLHLARTVCRRAEREIVHFTRSAEEVADCSQIIVYLNRLGDFLFVLARLVNLREGGSECIWHKP